MNIRFFHDDQHGTAIVCAAAILNGLRLQNKMFEDIKLVSTGGGAAGIACLDLLVSMGVKVENIWLVDQVGLVYVGREEQMNDRKSRYAQTTDLRTLDDVVDDADVFLGLSTAGILKPEMIKNMDPKPFILALANPNPEIDPDMAKKANPNVIMANRTLGLSEPGQQCAVFSVYFSGCTRLWCHRRQRRDEAGCC